MSKVAVQVDGKVRTHVSIPATASPRIMERIAREAVGILGKVTRIVVIPGRVINIITKTPGDEK